MAPVEIRTIGNYRLIRIVHSGVNSQIWQAVDERSQQSYAIKMPVPSRIGNRRFAQYFRHEYKVAKCFDSDRILRIFAFERVGGVPLLVMEWFPAPTMRMLIQDGIEKILELIPKIVLQAAEAVACFHRGGWIHRDIKPENFLVDKQGNVKLIDFALAKRIGGWEWLLRRKTPIQGTSSYMSPEQIRRQRMDERSDLYSLACTLFHLLAGRPPFAGSNTQELLLRHLKEPPPALDAVSPLASPQFANLLRRAMAKDPADRPPSTSHFLAELRTIPILRK